MNSIPNHAIITNDNQTWYFFHRYLEEDYTITIKKYEYNSLKEAQRQYKKIDAEYEKQMCKIRNGVHTSFSFKSYLQYWLYEIQYPKVAGRRKIVLNHMINRVIIPNIEENLMLNKITCAYLDKLLVRCKKHSETSGWLSQLILEQVFKTAMEDGYIKNNPMKGTMRLPRSISNHKALDEKDIPAFLQEAKVFGNKNTQSTGIYLEVLLALFCGLRKGEIMGLRFEDFDEQNQTVTIKRQQIYEPVEKLTEQGEVFRRGKAAAIRPKTPSSYRCLQIHPIIFKELQIRQKQIEDNQKKTGYIHDYDGYICVAANGSLKSDNTLTSGIKKVCMKANVPVVSCHDLRRTCATLLLNQGIDIKDIAKALGHQNPHTTLDHYCTTVEGRKDIAEFFDNGLSVGEDIVYE